MGFGEIYYNPPPLKVRVFPGLGKMGMSKRCAVEGRWRRKGFRLVDGVAGGKK